jgi:hypothetical protein
MKSLFTIIDNFYFKRNGTHLSENVRKKMVIHSKIKEKELVEDEEERQQEENGTVAAARPATSDKTQLTSSRLEDDEQEEKVESNKKDNKGSDEDFYLSTPSVKLPLKVRKSFKIVDRYPVPACLVVSCLPPLKLVCHLSRLFYLVLI